MSEDIEIRQNGSHLNVSCSLEVLREIVATILARQPNATISSDSIDFVVIRGPRDPEPTGSTWKDRACLVGCAIVAFIFAMIFMAGIAAISSKLD